MSLRGRVEAMSRQEQFAWLALALLVPATAYVGWWLFFDAAGQAGLVPEGVRRIGSGACLAFVFIRMWVAQRNKGVLVDERDRQISARSVASGYAWLALAVLVTSAIVGLDSWWDYLDSRSPAWIESFLLLCLLSSFVVIAAVGAVHYWRDRR